MRTEKFRICGDIVHSAFKNKKNSSNVLGTALCVVYYTM